MKQSSPGDAVHGRAVYLLVLVALLHFIYPITVSGSVAALILYQVVYTGMVAIGVLVAGDSRRHQVAAVGLGTAWLLFSVLYALDPASQWKVLATYAVLLPFQALVVWLLLRYIFQAQRVTRDVLYAAVTVYILLAALFVPVYGSLELLQPGSFVDNLHPGAPVFWQQFVYYSLITLTTTGYGDILPVSAWARAIATVEAVIGTLYLAILMARLVSLYSQHNE